MPERREQVALQIKEAAAAFLNRESNRESLITVTNADVSADLRNATVYITVYPDSYEERALHFARRKRSEFKAFLKTRVHLKRIPFVEFAIDKGEKHRQRIDDISREVE